MINLAVVVFPFVPAIKIVLILFFSKICLIKLGFNKNEAKVYLALIEFGKADAGQIIAETKFHKNIVYDNLDKLIDKGLVSFIIENKKKIFQIASSNSLIDPVSMISLTLLLILSPIPLIPNNWVCDVISPLILPIDLAALR